MEWKYLPLVNVIHSVGKNAVSDRTDKFTEDLTGGRTIVDPPKTKIVDILTMHVHKTLNDIYYKFEKDIIILKDYKIIKKETNLMIWNYFGARIFNFDCFLAT